MQQYRSDVFKHNIEIIRQSPLTGQPFPEKVYYADGEFAHWGDNPHYWDMFDTYLSKGVIKKGTPGNFLVLVNKDEMQSLCDSADAYQRLMEIIRFCIPEYDELARAPYGNYEQLVGYDKEKLKKSLVPAHSQYALDWNLSIAEVSDVQFQSYEIKDEERWIHGGGRDEYKIKKVTFVCRLKNGSKFMGETYQRTFDLMWWDCYESTKT